MEARLAHFEVTLAGKVEDAWIFGCNTKRILLGVLQRTYSVCLWRNLNAKMSQVAAVFANLYRGIVKSTRCSSSSGWGRYIFPSIPSYKVIRSLQPSSGSKVFKILHKSSPPSKWSHR